LHLRRQCRCGRIKQRTLTVSSQLKDFLTGLSLEPVLRLRSGRRNFALSVVEAWKKRGICIFLPCERKSYLNWPYLEQVFKLERRFTFIKTGKVQEQIVYGITSLSRDEITLHKLLSMIRLYWGIENGLHYRRDVTLHEDQTHMTKRNAARVMACLNNLVLSILIAKLKYRYLPRYFAAYPTLTLSLLTQL
jgi:hypothetical protein